MNCLMTCLIICFLLHNITEYQIYYLIIKILKETTGFMKIKCIKKKTDKAN